MTVPQIALALVVWFIASVVGGIAVGRILRRARENNS